MSTSAPYQSVPLPVAAVPSAAIDPGSLSWGAGISSIVGVLTLGILPAFVWSGKFFAVAEQENARLRAVADWVIALDESARSRQSLENALDALRPSRFLAMLPKLFAAFATSLLGMEFVGRQFTPDRLMEYTYRFPRQIMRYGWQDPFWMASHAHTQMVHQLWVGSLLAAYILQLIHVRWYRNGVRRFVREFNQITANRGILPVRMRTGAPLGALTVIGSVAFGMVGAWWGIPMLLAASVQSRYTMLTRRALAAQFADRTSRVAVRRNVERRCTAAGCRAMLPLPAKFCPQCGTPVPNPMVDMQG